MMIKSDAMCLHLKNLFKRDQHGFCIFHNVYGSFRFSLKNSDDFTCLIPSGTNPTFSGQLKTEFQWQIVLCNSIFFEKLIL